PNYETAVFDSLPTYQEAIGNQRNQGAVGNQETIGNQGNQGALATNLRQSANNCQLILEGDENSENSLHQSVNDCRLVLEGNDSNNNRLTNQPNPNDSANAKT